VTLWKRKGITHLSHLPVREAVGVRMQHRLTNFLFFLLGSGNVYLLAHYVAVVTVLVADIATHRLKVDNFWSILIEFYQSSAACAWKNNRHDDT
jgi:hypothetical protein